MAERYYLDTCIWRDFFESRIGLNKKPLGKYAAELFMKIINNKDILYFSNLTVNELKVDYDEKEIISMLDFLFKTGILQKVEIYGQDYGNSKRIADEFNIPRSDALHAILARNFEAILISQDKHMQRLQHMVEVRKPEEID